MSYKSKGDRRAQGILTAEQMLRRDQEVVMMKRRRRTEQS